MRFTHLEIPLRLLKDNWVIDKLNLEQLNSENYLEDQIGLDWPKFSSEVPIAQTSSPKFSVVRNPIEVILAALESSLQGLQSPVGS